MSALWRASTPESIDEDLASLWREAGVAGPVSRALMSNLVVVSPRHTFPGVEEVARRHPARTILLSYAPGGEEPAEGLRVGVVTFGESPSRYGLEFIAVQSTCSQQGLPSIVRRLTIGSVPTSVWWRADLSSPAPPEALSAIGRQILYDSAMWEDVKTGLNTAIGLLGQPQPPDLVDLNWRRLAPLRDALVHALRGDAHFAPTRVESARVSFARDEAAAAWLLAGWLRARLGVSATLEERDTPLLSVVIVADGSTLTLTLTPHHVAVTSDRPSFVVPVPSETEADAVATELLSLGSDRALCDSLRAIAATLASRG